MLKLIKITLAIVTLTSGWVTGSVAASFDCNKASAETEIAICQSDLLSALDDIIAEQYYNAADVVGWMSSEELKITQRAWIRERNKCGDEYECIYSIYTDRLKEISAGLLDITVTENFTSFIYEGEPVGDKCELDQSLSSWGECVTLVPAGGNFRGISVAGDLAFEYFYVGTNGHSCGIAGLAELVKNTWVYHDPTTSCRIDISLSASGLLLSPTEQCNDYCGMRAHGGIDRFMEY